MDSPIQDGLLGPGVNLMGAELSLEGALSAAREHYKRLPLCVVEDWIILDAILSDDEREKVAVAGCQPMFLFAHKVVHDEQRRFERVTGYASAWALPSKRASCSLRGIQFTFCSGLAIASLPPSKRYFPFS